MNPLVIIELLLRIVLASIEGQPPEVKAKLWEWYVADMTRWRKFLKIDETKDVSALMAEMRALDKGDG